MIKTQHHKTTVCTRFRATGLTTAERYPSEGKDRGPGPLPDHPAVPELRRWLRRRQVERRAECCSVGSIDRLGLEPRQGLVWQVLRVTPGVLMQTHTTISTSYSSSSSL